MLGQQAKRTANQRRTAVVPLAELGGPCPLSGPKPPSSLKAVTLSFQEKSCADELATFGGGDARTLPPPAREDSGHPDG